MTWKSQDPDGPETIFISTAKDEEQVHIDLIILVKKMIKNLKSDRAESAKKLLLYTNATNGYVQLAWFDKDDKSVGTWNYYLELPQLLEKANNSQDGASYFDNEVHIGICVMTEILIHGELDDVYDIYTQTELEGPSQLYI